MYCILSGDNYHLAHLVYMPRTHYLPLLLFFWLLPTTSVAQVEVGVSYELRDEQPQNGFGLRVETGMLPNIPLFHLGIRAHFSYFSDENKLTEQGLTYSQDITNYDLGIQAIIGINIGLVEPYVGLGLGTENIEIIPTSVTYLSGSNDLYDNILRKKNDQNLYWNASVGAKVSIIPVLKPFIEYRYTDTEIGSPEFEQFNQKTARIVIGVALRL